MLLEFQHMDCGREYIQKSLEVRILYILNARTTTCKLVGINILCMLHAHYIFQRMKNIIFPLDLAILYEHFGELDYNQNSTAPQKR